MKKYRPQPEQPNTPFRTAYGPKLDIAMSFPAHGMEKQSFKDECDINTIMAKYQATGLIDFVQENEPQYGDVSGLDYQEAMLTVATANSMFEELPSSWRKRFDNDPAQFLAFVDNPANRAEAIELGLITEEATPLATPPAKTPVGDPTPPQGGVSLPLTSPQAPSNPS